MARCLTMRANKRNSLVQTACERDVLKSLAQGTVICAESASRPVDPHNYAVQIIVADVRDGACFSSTRKEACSRDKVDTTHERMAFAKAMSDLPPIVNCACHRGLWRKRPPRRWNWTFELLPAGEHA